jgi:hypothetical protein
MTWMMRISMRLLSAHGRCGRTCLRMAKKLANVCAARRAGEACGLRLGCPWSWWFLVAFASKSFCEISLARFVRFLSQIARIRE